MDGMECSIGSLGKSWDEAGVENVTVTAVVLKGTQNGVRIKSWGRPSNSYVKNVLFKAIKMDVVQNPIIIDQNYCPNNIGCPGQVFYFPLAYFILFIFLHLNFLAFSCA